MHIDDAIEGSQLPTENCFGEFFSRDDAAGVLHQHFQQGKFYAGE